MRRMADPKDVVTKISKSDDGILVKKLDGTSYEVEVSGGGITPTGNINITTTNQVDVTNYATAQVVDANLIASNIRAGVSILGVEGSYDETDYLAQRLNNTLTSYGNSAVTSIPGYAFFVCNSLTTVNFPEVTSMGNFAFQSCSNLTTASFPKLTSITANAFYNCTNLTTTDFSKVTSMENSVFQDCRSLTSISFPKLTSIGGSAFRGCSSLTSITLGNSNVATLSNTNAIPASSSQHITIYVPSDLIASYQTATNWSTIYNNGYITFAAIS